MDDNNSGSALDSDVSRRKFLAWSTVVMGSAAAFGVAIPTIASLTPSQELAANEKRWSPLGADEIQRLSTATDEPIKIFFTRSTQDAYLPEEDFQEYAWAVRMSEAEAAQFRADRPDLFEVPAGTVPFPVINFGFVIFSPICPHLGALPTWHPNLKRFVCPAHGSQYDRLGRHIAGPAPRGLDPLPFREERGLAEITWVRFQSGRPDRVIVSYG